MVKNVVIAGIAVVIISAAILAGVYIGRSDKPTRANTLFETAQTPTPSVDSKVSITGEVKPFSIDILNHNNPNLSGIDDSVKSFEAGTYTSGKYKDYSRYLLLGQFGPGQATPYILASKDGNTFILDKTNLSTYDLDLNSKYSIFSKTKVTKSDSLPQVVPSELTIGGFDYVNTGIPTDYVEQGNEYNFVLLNPSKLKPLNKFESGHELFYLPEDLESGNSQTKTNLYLKDPTDLVYKYVMASPENYSKYKSKLGKTDWPDQTDLNPYFPKGAANKNGGHYESYQLAFPGGCALDSATWALSNLKDSDLAFDQTINGMDYYHLKDPNNLLNKLEYEKKINALPENQWKLSFPDVVRPSFETYVSKYPLLFFKDPFNRLVVVGEYDYMLPGGCGKPVIYLYPETPTNVSLNFETNVSFDVQIPLYKSGWQVVASPSGELKDLNWQASDCQSFDPTQFGSAYALGACQQNSYPYLYWSGNVDTKMPDINQGWFVTKSEANSFFQTKLQELGLTARESSDFRNYWVPKMQNSSKNDFKVTFLVDSQVNQLFPMSVVPLPNSLRRIFVQITPLAKKPKGNLKPQVLPSFNRTGFTMVEWGATNF